MSKEEYEKLCREILFHNRLYYEESSPIISDMEYDLLYKKVELIEKEHPEWVTEDSPTKKMGETVTSEFQPVEHRIPMLSLANTYSLEELQDFLKRMEKLTGQKDLAYSCELKMDGIAITARYEKGIFLQGVTRGDGKRGDDITTNMKTIKSLPLKLKGEPPEFLEVRGEVFMPHNVFEKLNEQKRLEEEVPWANPRNAAAGSLKLLDSQEVVKRKLEIVFYGVAEADKPPATQNESHGFMERLGLPILERHAKCHSLDEIWAFAEKIKKDRSHFAFDIDGIVVKLNDIQEQEKMGATGKNPRWAVAYKFAPEQSLTELLDITVQVGRTGVLTPVAELKPVFLAGSTISRATLHNMDEVERKGIRIGDFVTIEKGGDVIPKVVKVDLEKRPLHTIPWKIPDKCPICQTPVIRLEKEVALRCPNEACPQQVLRQIVFFVSKVAMDIDGLGERIVEQLMDLKFVKRPSDIYTLTEEQLYQLEGFKKKSVDNLLASLEKSKNVSLAKFIMALAIKHVGAQTAEDLAIRTQDIKVLMELNSQELLKIEGIGERVAESIQNYFADPLKREEIEKLLALGVHPHLEKKIAITGHAFQGKTFVVTGTLAKYTRSEVASLIKERGGKVTDSVSKKTDYLVAGEDPGSKLEKAQKFAVKILSLEEFETLL